MFTNFEFLNLEPKELVNKVIQYMYQMQKKIQMNFEKPIKVTDLQDTLVIKYLLTEQFQT